ncbi:MAG: three-Cys-motif partner protein TcmP [Burkholderiales bacterium]
MATNRFGGAWTERKLAALRDYLHQYQVIFNANERARNLKTIYVDAFAGTGDRVAKGGEEGEGLFGYDEEIRQYQDGSAKIALSLDKKFHKYIFLDSKASHIASLTALVEREFLDLKDRCEIVREDANSWLRKWCKGQDWKTYRAVVFLDPYGMSVEWKTIEAIALTKAIDLWVLFPFAIGVNRMTPKDELPEKDWGLRLTQVFGTVEWTKRFYRREKAADLFGGDHESIIKIAGADDILEFFLERLRMIFPHVVSKPLVLYNSHNSPMYALCFAAGNERGGKTALKIATHLAKSR